jgi:hypothetical protein
VVKFSNPLGKVEVFRSSLVKWLSVTYASMHMLYLIFSLTLLDPIDVVEC